MTENPTLQTGNREPSRRLREGRLVITSHNRGKIAEIAALLAPYDLEILTAGDLGLPAPAETGNSFAANAKLKARAAAQAANMPALSDDSGLEVKALGGRPGIYSARWGGENGDFNLAMHRILREMPPGADPAARFVCALAIAWPDPPPNGQTTVFMGKTTGRIIRPPRGQNGFGYDPILRPKDPYKASQK